jgi:hypothetical protein
MQCPNENQPNLYVDVSHIMLNKGSTAEPFVPYFSADERYVKKTEADERYVKKTDLELAKAVASITCAFDFSKWNTDTSQSYSSAEEMKMINLEYIDRIKILVSFMVKIMRSIDDKKIYYDMFHLVDIDDENSYEKFPFVKNAFDVFYKILDNLTEDCPFFQAIHQFNSLIYKDLISEKELHSGSILNLNDIKLELVKNIILFHVVLDFGKNIGLFDGK